MEIELRTNEKRITRSLSMEEKRELFASISGCMMQINNDVHATLFPNGNALVYTQSKIVSGTWKVLLYKK